MIAIGASILMPLYSLIKDTNTASLKLVEDNENLKSKIENLQKNLDNTKQEIDELKKNVKN